MLRQTEVHPEDLRDEQNHAAFEQRGAAHVHGRPERQDEPGLVNDTQPLLRQHESRSVALLELVENAVPRRAKARKNSRG